MSTKFAKVGIKNTKSGSFYLLNRMFCFNYDQEIHTRISMISKTNNVGQNPYVIQCIYQFVKPAHCYNCLTSLHYVYRYLNIDRYKRVCIRSNSRLNCHFVLFRFRQLALDQPQLQGAPMLSFWASNMSILHMFPE